MSQPWHKRYHGDALNGYMALTLEERGAYTTLLDLMYDSGEEGIVDAERLNAGRMNCSLRKYRALRDELIQKGKISRLLDGRLSNPRYQKEREKRLKISRENAENGKQGGEKSAEARKILSVINGGRERSLEERSTHTRATQKPEARKNPSDSIGRGTRLPAGFRPVPSGKTLETISRWPPGMLETEIDQFIDHHTAKGTVSKNWEASFRFWVRNAEKWRVRDAGRGERRSGWIQ